MTVEGITVVLMLIALILSLVLAIAFNLLYFREHMPHIAIWSSALYIMGMRVLILIESETISSPGYLTSYSLHFINDVLLILVDIIWIYGIFQFLEYSREKKNQLLYGFFGYLVLLALLYGIGMPESILIVEGATLVLIHPVLISYLFWMFYRNGKEVKDRTMQYFGIAFLIWAIDFILFGIPYFVYKNPITGALGWSVGVLFRLILLCAFIEIRKETLKRERTSPQPTAASR